MKSDVVRASAALALLAALPAACREKAPDDRIRVSGTVEVDTVKLVPLTGGRILEINIVEGKPVAKGEVVARIDCKELEIQLAQGEAALKQATANLDLVRQGARTEDKRQLKQVVKQATIARAQAKKDLDRADTLVKASSLPPKQLEELESRWAIADAQVAAAQQQLAKAMHGARPEEIRAVEAAVEQAAAAVALVTQRLTHCTVYSPVAGTVLYRFAEPGEAAAPGVPLGTVADLRTVTVKGFVAEDELGFVTIGGAAQVFIDSHPSAPLPAQVSRVSSEAEFTPKNVQTRDERVKTMYEIEVTVANPDGRLKAGMPADIVIRKGKGKSG